MKEAIAHVVEAMRLDPGSAAARNNLREAQAPASPGKDRLR